MAQPSSDNRAGYRSQQHPNYSAPYARYNQQGYPNRTPNSNAQERLQHQSNPTATRTAARRPVVPDHSKGQSTKKGLLSLPRCPYCGNPASYFSALADHNKGEYRCRRCGERADIRLKPALFISAAVAMALSVLFVLLFSLDRGDLTVWRVFLVLLPFLLFYALLPFLLRFVRSAPAYGRNKAQKSAGGHKSPPVSLQKQPMEQAGNTIAIPSLRGIELKNRQAGAQRNYYPNTSRPARPSAQQRYASGVSRVPGQQTERTVQRPNAYQRPFSNGAVQNRASVQPPQRPTQRKPAAKAPQEKENSEQQLNQILHDFMDRYGDGTGGR